MHTRCLSTQVLLWSIVNIQCPFVVRTTSAVMLASVIAISRLPIQRMTIRARHYTAINTRKYFERAVKDRKNINHIMSSFERLLLEKKVNLKDCVLMAKCTNESSEVRALIKNVMPSIGIVPNDSLYVEWVHRLMYEGDIQGAHEVVFQEMPQNSINVNRVVQKQLNLSKVDLSKIRRSKLRNMLLRGNMHNDFESMASANRLFEILCKRGKADIFLINERLKFISTYEEAKQYLSKKFALNSMSFSIMAGVLQRNGDIEGAHRLLSEDMKVYGVSPDFHTIKLWESLREILRRRGTQTRPSDRDITHLRKRSLNAEYELNAKELMRVDFEEACDLFNSSVVYGTADQSLFNAMLLRCTKESSFETRSFIDTVPSMMGISPDISHYDYLLCALINENDIENIRHFMEEEIYSCGFAPSDRMWNSLAQWVSCIQFPGTLTDMILSGNTNNAWKFFYSLFYSDKLTLQHCRSMLTTFSNTDEMQTFIEDFMPQVCPEPCPITILSLAHRKILENNSKSALDICQSVFNDDKTVDHPGMVMGTINAMLNSNKNNTTLSKNRFRFLESLVSRDDFAASQTFFNNLIDCEDVSVNMCNLMFKFCWSVDDAKSMLFETMPRLNLTPDEKSFAAAIDVILLNGDRESAKEIAALSIPESSSELPKLVHLSLYQGNRNLSIKGSVLLNSLMKTNDIKDTKTALRLFKIWQKNQNLINEYHFTQMMKLCVSSNEQRQLISAMESSIKNIPRHNLSYAYNMLVTSLMVEGNVTGARQVVNEEMRAKGISEEDMDDAKRIADMGLDSEELNYKRHAVIQLSFHRSNIDDDLLPISSDIKDERSFAMQFLENLQEKHLANRYHYATIINEIAGKAEWTPGTDVTPLLLYRDVLKREKNENIQLDRNPVDLTEDTLRTSQNIVVDMHSCSKAVSLTKLSDVLLQIWYNNTKKKQSERQKTSNTHDIKCLDTKLLDMQIIVGRGNGSGLNLSQSIQSSFVPIKPVVRNAVATFLSDTLTPPIDYKYGQKNGSIFIKAAEIENWCKSKQPDDWESAIQIVKKETEKKK